MPVMAASIDLQRRLADALVALGWAHRKPLAQTRCAVTIELASVNRGNYYVTRQGHVLHGYTVREAQPIGPQCWRNLIDAAGQMMRDEGRWRA